MDQGFRHVHSFVVEDLEGGGICEYEAMKASITG